MFADAPELGKKALENVLREIKSQLADTPPPSIQSAGGVGARLGKVSELTIIVPLVHGWGVAMIIIEAFGDTVRRTRHRDDQRRRE